MPEVRQYRTMPDTQQMSFLSLSTTLFPTHYHNGQLILKCTAHVTTIYRKTTEVHLSSRAREPIPERGTLQTTQIVSIMSGGSPETVYHCCDLRFCCHVCRGFLSVPCIFRNINSHECALSTFHAFLAILCTLLTFLRS